MATQEDKQLQAEMSKLAEWRVKKLEGLTRRDRLQMIEISEEYEDKRSALLKKYGKEVTAANIKAAAQESAKKQKAAVEADKLAAAKQDKKNPS